MQDFAEHELELDHVLAQVAGSAATEAAASLVRSWSPSPDPQLVDNLLRETTEGIAILDEGKRIPGFEGVFGIERFIDIASRGGLLEPEGLYQVARTLEAALRIKSDLAHHRERAPSLNGYGKWIRGFDEILDSIDACIDRDLTVKDSASPALKKIRRELASARDRIHKRATDLMRGLSDKGYLQDAVVTMRNNRFVLPFRAEFAGKQELVVQDVSGSAATTFAEPMPLVGLNNELQALVRKEAAEVERVLRELSKKVGDRAGDVRNAWEAAVRLDARFAAAKWCREKECIRPEISKDEILLYNCRHPLIAPPVTPVEVRIEPPGRCMVITGPNAGGKTAALKTLGLFAMMLQCGLTIPAGEGSRLPIFTGVFAEIGDEQSLEGSLSTFSAHIAFVKGMLERLAGQGRRERFLVLLDEIGRATDPSEGSALALSVIERLLEYRTHVIVTTHLPALKNLAMSGDERIFCSTVDFDLEHLKPLFHISYGVPGKSYALQVARRLGLSEEVIEKAYSKLGQGHVMLEEDIAKLEQVKSRMEGELMDLRESLAAEHARSGELAGRSLAYISFGMGVIREGLEQAEKILRKARQVSDGLTEATVEDLRRARKKVLKQARAEAERIKAKAKESVAETQEKIDEPDGGEVEAALESVTERSDTLTNTAKQIEDAAGQLKDGVDEAAEVLLEGEPEPVDLDALEVGELVYVRPLKIEGEVMEINKRAKRVTVSIGGIASTVKPDQLRATGRLNKRQTDVKLDTSGLDRQAYRKVVGMTLDLHGMRVDEALDEIERYLDEAFVAHHKRVVILHGIGTGALRSAVRRYLHKHPLVDSYHPGQPQDGGPGATSVQFVGKH